MARPLPDPGDARYRPFEEDGLRGYAHESFRPTVPSMAWVAGARPAPEDVLKESPETTVFRIVAPGWPGEVVMKRYHRPGRLAPWKDRFRLPRSLRALLSGVAFLREGIPTPEPVAAVAPAGGAGACTLVCRSVFGFRTLAEALHEMPVGHAERPTLLEEVMVLVREMHQRHVYHGDLKPGNVLLRDEEDCRRLSLIDLDAARVRRRFSLRLAARDLAQLHSYLGSASTAAEQRRFLALYAYGWPRRQRRTLLRWTLGESRRREERRCAV